MTDERLHRWLEEADRPLAPNPEFAGALRDSLRAELGFVPRPAVRTEDAPRRRTGNRRGPTQLLLVAALFAAGAVGTVAVVGSLVDRSLDRRSVLFDRVQQTGSIRIAIRPDHPQFEVSSQPAAGLDNDVAGELGRHLGFRADTVLVDASAMLSGQQDELWDIALPSVAESAIDPSRFLVSSPYYRWPRRLIVPDASTAQRPADLAGQPICAVAADAGEAWLRGEYGGVASSPITSQIVTRASDDECLAALAAGDVTGMVTARMSDADLHVRSGIRVIGGPDPEPRPVIVRRAQDGGADPIDLLRAIDSALDQMRSDGTLTRLSQSRFGGADLTGP
jgi:ABC-type amino acid transport substrate-binding protein